MCTYSSSLTGSSISVKSSLQRRHHAEVGFRDAGGDLLDRGRLRRDPHALRGDLGGEGGEAAGGLGVGAVDVERDRLAATAQQRHGADQRLDAEAVGQATVVDDSQLALARWRSRLAALAEDPLVGGVHHYLGALGVDAAFAQQLARLLGDEDVAVGHRGADPLLGADQANQRVARRPVEEGGEELGEGVVEVEDQRHAAQLRPQRGEDQGVGHVVDLDQVEAARRDRGR